jgi:hypothetical protein
MTRGKADLKAGKEKKFHGKGKQGSITERFLASRSTRLNQKRIQRERERGHSLT